MPQKLNKAGQMQDYIPAGNGDPSGEYGTAKGTNKNFTASDKKKTQANVITENKSVVVGDKKTTYKGDLKQQEESLKNRIENLEGVIKNIENGDPTGAEDLQDMKRRLKNAKEDYERQFGKDSNRLRKILEERNQNEDIDHAIDTDYFGFGSLDKLEEAHKNNYGKNKANIIDNDLTGKKEYQLDSELVKQANSTKAFYEAGDNIQNKLDYYIKEIDNFVLTPEEKKQAKDKLFNLATDSLKSTSKNMSWVRSGRGNFDFKKSDKAWDKEMKDRNTFENYFNELKSNNEKKAKQSQAKTEQEQYIEAYKKANETGALEMTVNGKTYVRSRKTSRTWYEKQ